ncbi:unnamed protein product [Didymodactylos carnosus]|uniref:ADP-ribosylglycohydrolase n=1 Tax=Didymodactylos carnosus TaxID=1234261 RepID=A0A8S2FLP5_9BILA|nr:unnamed protein product [Didymodactylos carnosus]CAF4290047.1 unnamed protein product [Didymodactylos carnosus]
MVSIFSLPSNASVALKSTQIYPHLNNHTTFPQQHDRRQYDTLQSTNPSSRSESPSTPWLNLTDVRPADIQYEKPPSSNNPENDMRLFDKIHGSMIGMAIGDALGAHVEFRPRAYLEQNPVSDMQGGGTWGLKAGQWTDDTSMALCLAASLIVNKNFNSYDQLVRYKWWWRKGYMSSIGKCFDIGNATKASLDEFVNRQHKFCELYKIKDFKELDQLSDESPVTVFLLYSEYSL